MDVPGATRCLALGALLVLVAGLAEAQMPGGDARRGGQGGSIRPAVPAGPGDDRGPAQNLPELVQMRLAQLEEDLNLKPEQGALWKAYRGRVQQLLDDTRRASRTFAASADGDGNAPRRLDALADQARNRLTAIEDVVDAGKALYAVLTPAQKEIADRRLALPLATLTSPASATATAAELRRPGPADGPPPEGRKP